MFGNPGTTELPLMDAFAVETDIRYILGLQEAALMAMADGYAQASGKLAVSRSSRRARARQCHGHALRRDESQCANAGHRGSNRIRNISSPSRCCRRTRPRSPGRSANASPKSIESTICRAGASRGEDCAGAADRAGVLSLPGDILKNDGDIDLLKPTRVGPRIRGDIDAVTAAAESWPRRSAR